MLKSPSIGALLILSHYLGTVTVGIIFRNYKSIENKSNVKLNSHINLKKALDELIKARKNDGRSISTLMSDSIKSAFESLIMIGGFIVMYSVIIEILNITGVIGLMADLVQLLLPLNTDTDLIKGFVSGLLEITNGCRLISMSDSSNIVAQICTISFLIGWSGLSIHSQAISMLSKTDINEKIYIFSKFLHAVFSSIYSYLLYKLFFKKIAISSFLSIQVVFQNNIMYNLLNTLKLSISLGLSILFVILAIALIVGVIYNAITQYIIK